MSRRAEATLWFFLVAILLVLPFFGTQSIGISALWDSATADHRVLTVMRYPRWLAVLIIGGSLSVLGAVYQTVFKNPIADPYLLGVAPAVSLVAAVQQIYAIGPEWQLGTVLLGVVTSFLVCSLLFFVSSNRLVLFGTGLTFFFSSLLFFILSIREQTLGGSSMRWLFGHVPWLSWKEALFVSGLGAALGVVIYRMAPRLEVLGLGDTVARSLGVSPGRERAVLMAASSILLGGLVSLTGAIGFVGLVVPHVVHVLFRPVSLRAVVVRSFGIGAFFLAFSDVLSRIVLPPLQFPIGVITTLIGAPLFLWWMARR